MTAMSTGSTRRPITGERPNGLAEVPYVRRPPRDGPEAVDLAILNLRTLLDRYEPSERQWAALRRLTDGTEKTETLES